MTVSRFRYELAFVLFLAAGLFACHTDTEKEKVERTLSVVRTAAQNRDAGAILDRISKSYRDPRGNDYEKIRGMLIFYFVRYRSVNVVMTGLETDIRDGSAEVRFQAILSGRTGSAANILPEALGAYRFTVLLKPEAGEWVVTSANWERTGDGLEKTQ